MPPLLVPIQKECQHCGKTFGAPQKNSRFCSSKCKWAAHRAIQAQRRINQKSGAPRQCVLCGAQIPPKSRSDKKYCSETCGFAARINLGRMDRRLRITDDGKQRFFRRSDIYRRDDWKCQICFKPIDRSLRFPNPKCASIDHIIPVSMGGTNRPENLQTSHLRCNVALGNRKTTSTLRPAPVWGDVEYVSVSKAAEVWGMSRSVVARLVKEGIIPTVEAVSAGKWPKIPLSFVESVMANGQPEQFSWKRYNHSNKPMPRPIKPNDRDLLCRWCGKQVKIRKGLTSPRKYCSKDCLRQSKLSRNRRKVRKEPRKTENCIVCGRANPLIPNAYQTVICGRGVCKKALRQMRYDERRLRERKLPQCQTCGKTFKWRERGGGQQIKYCSQQCRIEAARERARLHHAKKRQ